jgi:ABC-type phosphate/phosphonate transport system substrate-binding protein
MKMLPVTKLLWAAVFGVLMSTTSPKVTAGQVMAKGGYASPDGMLMLSDAMKTTSPKVTAGQVMVMGDYASPDGMLMPSSAMKTSYKQSVIKTTSYSTEMMLQKGK